MGCNNKIFFRIQNIKFRYITFLFLLLPKISCNSITMKFKGKGEEQLFMNANKERPCPNKIIVDNVIIPNHSCKYKFPNKIVTVKINLNKDIKNFQNMFSDISNIIEISLNQIDTSLVEYMNNMFENCSSLIFANLSNINISSVTTMEKMFSNCISLKSLDLTNVDISKVSNHKMIFNNCIHLKINFLDITNSKKLNSGGSIEETCNIRTIFNEPRTCQINLNTINDEIIDGLNDAEYREYLIDKISDNENEFEVIEGNEKFSILITICKEKIDLNECETIIRDAYEIRLTENIFIYKHEKNISNLYMPIINFEVFDANFHFNMSYCYNSLIYLYIPININEEELYRHNPSGEYYFENCTQMKDKSLYERKQEYNDQNLALCQKNCKYYNYDSETKKVECHCLKFNSKINEISGYFDKFELKNEDKYKCKIYQSDIDAFSLMFEDTLNSILGLKKGKDKEIVFDDMIREITSGSLDQIIDQIINNNKDFVMTADGDKYHLTTLTQQFETQYLSAVDLGNCEDKLRQEYDLGNQEILIFKVDHLIQSFKIPIIEYVLFTENGKININLDSCKGIPVNYYIPVNISGDQLYLYDPDNEFYNDKCHQYTSESGTDVTIYDRKNDYNVKNMSLCENGCEFEGYNETTLKTKCTCPIKTERNFFEIDENKLLNKFKNYKEITNILIVKCFNLVFSSKGLKKNIGSYIIISIAAINGALIAFFILRDSKI